MADRTKSDDDERDEDPATEPEGEDDGDAEDAGDNEDDGERDDDDDAEDAGDNEDDGDNERDDDDDDEDAGDNEDDGDNERDDEDEGDDESKREPEDDDALGRDRARKAAAALGVGEADKDPGASAARAGTPANRAERRRALARQRRKGRPIDDNDEQQTPKDRNLRKRQELLERRKRAAQAAPGEPSDVSLAVDDALARGGAAGIAWLKRNWKWLQWGIVASVVASAGTGVYLWRTGESSKGHSDALLKAIGAEQAAVVEPDKDKRSDEEKKKDTRLIYVSHAERAKAALSRYEFAAGSAPGSATAILAQLGLAGLHLDKRDWDAALAGYQEVLRSKLAEADADVKGRALEGIGFAYEGKADVDKAQQSFERLGNLADPMYKTLSKYHRARVIERKGDKNEAKKLLVEARKDIADQRIEAARVAGAGNNPYHWLDRAAEEALRRIDPSAVEPRLPPGGLPANMTPQQLEQYLKQQRPVETPPE